MPTKKYVIQQKQTSGEPLTLHPETDADIVKVAANGIQATNVQGALEELNNNIASITGGGVVTGVKGEAETAYRLGQVNITKANIGLGNVDNTSDANKPVSAATQTALNSKADLTAIADFITKSVNDLTYYYTKTDIDGKIATINNNISAIPKFAIAVVENLPTSDISSTTIYIKKTSTTETGNLYTEYIYVNNEWEELGTQTLDLSGYTTTEALNAALAEYTKTASLSTIAKTGKLADAKDDATHRVVTDTEKTAWNGKIDKSSISGQIVYAEASDSTVPSTKAVYNELYNTNGVLDKIAKGTTVAGKAKQLETARKISLTGDATGETTFDGTVNKEIAVTLAASGVIAGTYSAVSVNAKGLVTAGAQLIEVGNKTGTNTPTANLAIGGIFFKEI